MADVGQIVGLFGPQTNSGGRTWSTLARSLAHDQSLNNLRSRRVRRSGGTESQLSGSVERGRFSLPESASPVSLASQRLSRGSTFRLKAPFRARTHTYTRLAAEVYIFRLMRATAVSCTLRAPAVSSSAELGQTCAKGLSTVSGQMYQASVCLTPPTPRSEKWRQKSGRASGEGELFHCLCAIVSHSTPALSRSKGHVDLAFVS